MPRPETDRNLLFGVIALQMDFITRDALVAAMNAWAVEKHRPLGEILVEREALDPADRALLEPMVDRHVAKHGGDPLASLAALSSAGGIAADLERSVGDPTVLESIALIKTVPPEDPHATQSLETTAWHSSGTRFRKVRDHARGGLGVVFVARDEELHREVALKEIQDRHADDLDKRARFLMEAEITGGLEHPGIVPVYALGHYDDGRPFYAMRFIKGDSLKEAIGRFHADPTLKQDPGQRALALQKLLRRFLDVCNAVAYAHSRGILHRDLKPDNVMVGKYGETLVVDWGLAKIVGRTGEDNAGELPEATLVYTSPSGSAETLPGSVIGTPAYMSPEQAVGRLDLLGPRSDVYSLGATLYSLLTGRVPFADKTLREVLRKVEQGEFPRPREASPWLDPALEAICLKAMALRPDDRYATPQALAEDLERWLADEPVAAFPEPLTRRARRWGRKHRTTLATAASAATVAALLLGGVAWVRIAQRQRTDAAAQATFRDADILAIEARTSGDLARWEKAISEALRARERLESGDGSPALRREGEVRVEALRAEQARRREVLEAEEKDRRVVADLDEARLNGANVLDGHFDFESKLESYLAAFRAYGIDLASLSVEDAAKKIRSSKVAGELISALDDQVVYQSRTIPSERLKAIAGAAENDPVRAAIRDSVARGDVTGLRHRIERPEDRVRLGPQLRTVFNALLQLDTRADLPLLETVRGEHVSDFWINHDLGKAYLNLKPVQAQEAVRCLSVAVALRPNSPGVRVNFGKALQAQGKFDQATEAYRKAIQISPDYAEARNNLGTALAAQGNFDGAVEAYRKAIQIKPNFAALYTNLGLALRAQGKLDQAVEAHRKAIQIKPDYADSYTNLGLALQAQRKFDLAIEAQQKAIQLRPDFVEAHSNLGAALFEQGKSDQAVESYRDAIRLDSNYAPAHHNLGIALQAQGKLDQAVACHRKAIQLKPDHADAHYALGIALLTQSEFDQAVESFRKAIELKPNHALAYSNLGVALQAQGKLDQAVEAYRKVIQIRPNPANAYFNLGLVLQAQGKLDEAVEAYQKAIQIRPDFALAYSNLGVALQAQGKLDRAAEAYRQAIQLRPDAQTCCDLGLLLGTMGRFQEALDLLERGHMLGSKQPGWKSPSQQWVQQHRRFLELDIKLPSILKGEAKPADAAERLDLAAVCYRKGLHAHSARLADEAFTEKPALADNLQTGTRYNAACSASLAGSGQGKDDPRPDEASRMKFREQALGWLKADLKAWAKVLEGGNEPARKQTVIQQLTHWKQDADLAGIRDEMALAKLPDSECEAFRAFWADIDRLLAKAQAGK